MPIVSKTSIVTIAACCLLGGLFFANAARAQYTDGNFANAPKSTQQLTHKISAAPLALASMGQIGGPQAGVPCGVNTAGTVRVNMLAMLESLLNIVANGTEIVGVLVGVSIYVIARNCMKAAPKRQRVFTILAPVVIVLAVMFPAFVNFLVASARDANLFS